MQSKFFFVKQSTQVREGEWWENKEEGEGGKMGNYETIPFVTTSHFCNTVAKFPWRFHM